MPAHTPTRLPMTALQRTYHALWIASLASHVALLWFCMEQGEYAIATGRALSVSVLIDSVVLVIALNTFHSLGKSFVKVFFGVILPAITLALLMDGDPRRAETGMLFQLILLGLLAAHFAIDLLLYFFGGRQASSHLPDDDIDDDGSAGLLYRTDPKQ